MKKFLVLLVIFLLVGCSNDKLENITIDRNHIIHTYGDVPIGATNNGLYFVENDIMYYKEDNQAAVPLGYVDYKDGEKTNFSYEAKTRRDDLQGYELICYGDRIYMLYYTKTHDGDSYYQLASVDLKGEDFKTHIIFDYLPQDFKMNNGKIYVTYIDEINHRYYIETYNQNFELENTRDYEYISNFYIEDGELVVIEDEAVVYENAKVKIINTTEWISEDAYIGTGIIQIEDEQFTFENKTVLYVNDKYFYVASDTYPQTYERYHLNGELDKSIVINEHIESAGNFSCYPSSDFSYIQILKDENIVYGYANPDNPKIFEVNFVEETCNYINE